MRNQYPLESRNRGLVARVSEAAKLAAVSYTHLDVYKRQLLGRVPSRDVQGFFRVADILQPLLLKP